ALGTAARRDGGGRDRRLLAALGDCGGARPVGRGRVRRGPGGAAPDGAARIRCERGRAAGEGHAARALMAEGTWVRRSTTESRCCARSAGSPGGNSPKRSDRKSVV